MQFCPSSQPYLRVLYLLLVLSAGMAGIIGSGGGGGADTNGGEGSAPVLSSLSISPDTVAAGLLLDIGGQFSFSDPDGDLDGGAFRYTYDTTNFSIPLPVSLAGITNADVLFSVTVQLSNDTGTRVIPIWLEDKAGHISNIVDINFTQLWTRQWGTAAEDIASALSMDGSDRLYVAGDSAGGFAGLANSGGKDVLLRVYDAGGAPQWTDLYGGAGDDVAVGIAVGSAGQLYVAGHTDSASFDGQASAGDSDLFLSRYSPAGTRQWTVLLASPAIDELHGLAIDSSDNLYLVGRTFGDLDGELNAGGGDGFIARFDGDGVKQWVRLLGSSGSDVAYAIAVDGQNRITVAGGTDGLLGDDPSPGDPLVNFDMFVVEYNVEGQQQWLSQLGTACSEWATGVAIDSNSNRYLVGKIGYGASCAFAGNTASGGWDAFLMKTNAAGVAQWVDQFGTANEDVARGVAVDRNDSIYVTGYLDSTYFTGDNEGHRVFLARYDGLGTQVWQRQQDGGVDFGDQGRALVTDSNDDIFIAAITHGAYHGHSNLGDDDVVLLKYDASGEPR